MDSSEHGTTQDMENAPILARRKNWKMTGNGVDPHMALSPEVTTELILTSLFVSLSGE